MRARARARVGRCSEHLVGGGGGVLLQLGGIGHVKDVVVVRHVDDVRRRDGGGFLVRVRVRVRARVRVMLRGSSPWEGEGCVGQGQGWAMARPHLACAALEVPFLLLTGQEVPQH